MTYGRPIFTNFDQPLVENEFMDASAPMDYQMVVAQSDSYEEKHRKLNAVLAKHKVSVAQGDQLFQLTEMKITFICDDSGSMNMSADTKKYTHSRWKELQETNEIPRNHCVPGSFSGCSLSKQTVSFEHQRLERPTYRASFSRKTAGKHTPGGNIEGEGHAEAGYQKPVVDRNRRCS
eukprot:TRINITY_DN1075_c0_g4_i2.p1 TRINITY_DN1075_c0_g4~~TRINITY_DN1075_c0_g4_i2.p1  ORF type:complete len:177 (+),score=25.09 TRINITY_DN1075_c0_g4_i2:78-608(+)